MAVKMVDDWDGLRADLKDSVMVLKMVDNLASWKAVTMAMKMVVLWALC